MAPPLICVPLFVVSVCRCPPRARTTTTDFCKAALEAARDLLRRSGHFSGRDLKGLTHAIREAFFERCAADIKQVRLGQREKNERTWHLRRDTPARSPRKYGPSALPEVAMETKIGSCC